MLLHLSRLAGIAVITSLCLYPYDGSFSQETVPVRDAGTPAVPKGVEVMARGPVHEAFASPASEPAQSPLLAKKPPTPVEEMPPEEKPEGDVVWIGGYWSWDDDRTDYLWVSGCWRTKPPGKEWVPGYWREQGERWQWVAGFWANAQPPQAPANPVTYYPEPPAPPAVAPPPPQPGPDMVYIPGHWSWQGDHYVWMAGFWRPIREGYVWVPAHYRWTPFGYVYVAGYWDLAVTRRGVLYAPVVVDVAVCGPTFVFTPAYAVCDVIVLDSLFIRPAYCHYYFGDYYGPRYVGLGFETCIVYSRCHYEPIIAYCAWENRANPAWINVQINLVSARNEGRAPLPPRTLVQQTNITNINNVTNVTNVKNVTNISNVTALAPTKAVAAARGQKTVALAPAARTEALQSARSVQLAAVQQRQKTEIPLSREQMAKPRTANLNVPPLPGKSAPPPANTINSKMPSNNTAPIGGKGTNTPPPGVGAPHPPTGPGGPSPKGPGGPPPKGPPAGHQPPMPQHKAPPPKKDHPHS